MVVLHGEPYPKDDYANPDTIRRHNARDLTNMPSSWNAYPSSPSIGSDPMYATFSANWSGASRPSARSPCTSPASAPNTSGASTEPASQPHSSDLGLDSLADPYTAFYLSGWDYVLSNFTYTPAYRAAILAGTQVLTEAAALGRQWLRTNSGTR